MENRKEFERFTALYWGQRVYCNSERNGNIIELTGEIIDLISVKPLKEWLQLRSIESLTDEELIIIAGLDMWPNPNKEQGISSISIFKHHGEFTSMSPQSACNIIDYLRSIGIAVPFMQYSVEDMVKMGWINII